MEFATLAARPGDWDRRIGKYDAKSLFHESAWLDFDLSCHPEATAEYYSLLQNGETVGYFCALRRSMALIRVYQSPFSGRGVYLSPIVNRNADPAAFVEALLRLCRLHRIGFVEIADEWFPADVMNRFGFETRTTATHVCSLVGGRDAIWARMKGTCRNRIRKGEQAGLVVEATQDLAIAEHFLDIFTRVLAQRGLRPAYGVEIPRRMMTELTARDRAFAVWVKRHGEVIGAGFYPHDDRALYFWDGASLPDHLELSPNELLHWKAMQLAAERGIAEFRIGGGPVPSRFTTKFGGTTIPLTIYRKSLTPLAKCVRQVHHWLRGT